MIPRGASQRIACFMDPAWDSLRSAGFSLVDRVVGEFQRPHYLAYLFDSADECVGVVKGLHGESFNMADVLRDAKIYTSGQKIAMPALERTVDLII